MFSDLVPTAVCFVYLQAVLVLAVMLYLEKKGKSGCNSMD